MFGKTRPKMVLADIQLADGSSGIEAVNEILSSTSVPVIFITAFPEERIRAKALDDVSSCMLSKPFDSRVLIECLATALGKTGA